ncbi:hypothetical protein [Burkholderia sp. Ac-20392]|uniref:CC0125/CC1285 family lipoprotein n=1 Tax=Burkholderia sp. Ac-20392 TaxID=2703905 RepID=UPI0019826F67|nr:hypothetical protein [Burkholderia sp. Ac-20392]MBN3793837.1 hypothetical protein [Burkholderia sp. Ac-20392]
MNSLTKSFLALSTLCMLTACATPYQRLGSALTTGGYSEERIDDATYRVKFTGNPKTSDEKVGRYLLYRCADLTRQMGFRYFVMVPEAPTGGLSMNDRPPADPHFDRQFLRKVAYGGVIFLPGGVSISRSKWVTIHMLQDPKAVPLRMVGWDVNEVFSALDAYVHSDGATPGHVPPASVFDPVAGKIAYQSPFGPSSSRQDAPEHPSRSGAVPMESLDGLLPGGSHAR